MRLPLCFEGNTLIVVHVRQNAVDALSLSKDLRCVLGSALIEKSIAQLKVSIAVCRVGLNNLPIEKLCLRKISALLELDGLLK